ncbi:MAG TPA: hypothetical protein VJN70_06710 [Gemmatimonadaceae bacterium]|nr:hypothetical protein [Gemmatimonadaceae bacterium]
MPRRVDGALSTRSAARAEALADVQRELEDWRARTVPDPSMPLEAEDVARLVGDCLASLALDEATASSFTVNTVHFYRRKEILDAPEGRTSAARYTLRHLWQAVGARLAGQLGLLTLAEAREEMSGRSESVLLAFVAERVLDARARQAVRRSAAPMVVARPLAPIAPSEDVDTPRPLPNVRRAIGTDAVVLSLPGHALCVVPISHRAHRSAAAARALGRALTDALLASNRQSDS